MLTRAQSRAIDRVAMEDYGIPGIVLMENAASGIAAAAQARFPTPGLVAVACGPGNNGGDGFAAARHLKNKDLDSLAGTLSNQLGGTAAAPTSAAGRALIKGGKYKAYKLSK